MKKIVALVLTLAMALSFATFAVAEKTDVVIWHTFTNEQNDALCKAAEDFNASQDEYNVVVQSQNYQGFENDVYQAVANGVGPSIIFNYASEAARYVKDGKVVDLTPYINDPEIGMADVFDSLPERIKAEATGFEDGGIHYLPGATTGPILFYNKTLYDELGLTAPKTWEELAEQSKLIYEKKGIPGFAADSLTDLIITQIMQTGSSFIDVDTKTVGFDNEKTEHWLNWYGENVQNGYFLPAPTIDNYISSDFNAGNVAAYSGSCAGDKYISPNGFEYDVAPLPTKIDNEYYVSWQRGPIVFAKDDVTDRGAYLFVKYFLSPEVNEKWCEAMSALSPYGTTSETDAYKAFAANLSPALKAVEVCLPVAGGLPSVTGASEIRNQLKEAMTMCSAGVPAKEALATCVAASNAALQAE